jgi:hypothetical protein
MIKTNPVSLPILGESFPQFVCNQRSTSLATSEASEVLVDLEPCLCFWSLIIRMFYATPKKISGHYYKKIIVSRINWHFLWSYGENRFTLTWTTRIIHIFTEILSQLLAIVQN